MYKFCEEKLLGDYRYKPEAFEVDPEIYDKFTPQEELKGIKENKGRNKVGMDEGNKG